MKPAAQTDFSKGAGNCWSACIASILEIDVADVPNFCHHELGPKWFKRTLRWLTSRGIGVVHIQKAQTVFLKNPILVDGFCIVTGKSPRSNPDSKRGEEDDWLHAIVGKSYVEECPEGYLARLDFVYDPHPSGAMIVGDVHEVTILIPPAPSFAATVMRPANARMMVPHVESLNEPGNIGCICYECVMARSKEA